MGIAILSRAHSIGDMQDAVDATTFLARRQVERGKVPPWWRTNVRYRAEERIGIFPNVERFNTPEEMIMMGADDCDGHAPYLAGSLQAYDIDARAIVVPSPGVGYHVVVELPGGRIIDPSARRGMLDEQVAGRSRAARAIRRARHAAALRAKAARLTHLVERAVTEAGGRLTRAQAARALLLLKVADAVEARATRAERAAQPSDDDDGGDDDGN